MLLTKTLQVVILIACSHFLIALDSSGQTCKVCFDNNFNICKIVTGYCPLEGTLGVFIKWCYLNSGFQESTIIFLKHSLIQDKPIWSIISNNFDFYKNVIEKYCPLKWTIGVFIENINRDQFSMKKIPISYFYKIHSQRKRYCSQSIQCCSQKTMSISVLLE